MYVRKSHDHSFEILGLDENHLELLMRSLSLMSEHVGGKDQTCCNVFACRISHFLEERRAASSGFNRIGQKKG